MLRAAEPLELTTRTDLLGRLMLKLLDLFSGIGGFSLGLERSGAFETVAFCEIEPYCQKVLAKHWPKVPIYNDVRTITAEQLAADGIAVDAICGGFPCQDISTAGKGAGLAGERSGLWYEYARIIGEVRPRYVIVENVAALLARGLDEVLRALDALGYDAEWHCIPASAVGAPHRRDRVWIVAYTNDYGSEVRHLKYSKQNIKGQADYALSCCENVAYADRERKLQSQGRVNYKWRWPSNGCETVADAYSAQCEGSSLSGRIYEEYANSGCSSWWSVEPDVGRVANGVPARAHRLRALGNAVVPQIPELIGRAIAAQEAAYGF